MSQLGMAAFADRVSSLADAANSHVPLFYLEGQTQRSLLNEGLQVAEGGQMRLRHPGGTDMVAMGSLPP